MAQATGSRKQVAFITETVFGTTPATPTTQLLEIVDFSGSLNTPLLTDPSINSNRQVTYARRGNESVQVDMEVVACASNYDAFIEAAFQGTWATNVLKLGTTQRSFAIEEGFNDIGQYHTFNGCVIDSMQLAVTTDKLVSIKFAMLGATESAFDTSSICDEPVAVPSKPKFYHVNGTFKEGGAAVGYLTSVQFQLKNGLDASNALGASGVRAITTGRAELTGQATALFEDAVMYNKFKNNTDSSIEFTLTDGTNSHAYFIPKVKYTKAQINGNSDGPLVVELDFTAVYDTTTGTSLGLTRT